VIHSGRRLADAGSRGRYPALKGLELGTYSCLSDDPTEKAQPHRHRVTSCFVLRIVPRHLIVGPFQGNETGNPRNSTQKPHGAPNDRGLASRSDGSVKTRTHTQPLVFIKSALTNQPQRVAELFRTVVSPKVSFAPVAAVNKW